MTITLADATAWLPHARRRGDAVIVDVTHDSRQVAEGFLFCCIPGSTTDGHDHAPAAVERGASALLVERWLDLPVAQVRLPSVRAAAGPVAAAVHGQPSRRLCVVGVTGTNGKTSTVYLLETAFGAAGLGTGMIGTVEVRVHGQPQAGVRTTPEGPDLQRLLATMHARGVDAVAMEVSSHGLALHRVDGTRFAVAVFTNLSHDHLDFHGDMESYYRQKARLFTPQLAERAVVCVDDDWGRRLADEAAVPVTAVGSASQAEHRIVELESDLEGTRFVLTGPHGRVRLTTALLGAFNARNAACAYLAAVEAGVPADAAAEGVAACRRVPGRLEPVRAGQPFTVLVDYAHTPAALGQVMATARGLLPDGGRLHVVVGCGGDRDRDKRPLMGAQAARADFAVLTSDNPRSEDPAAILEETAAGARAAVQDDPEAKAQVEVEIDRRKAIARAVQAATRGDIVLIAGKGHETTQEFADRSVPFDDRAVAAELLADLAARVHPRTRPDAPAGAAPQ